jgi:hypothetical protein
MKTCFSVVPPFILMVFLFSHCRKENTVYQGYFYSLNSQDEARLNLFIDGENKGELPFIKHQAGFTSDSIKYHALKLPFYSGKHKLEAKDQNGQIRSSGTVSVSKNKSSSRGGVGGQEMVIENNEVRIGFSF